METYYEEITPDRAAEYLIRNAAGRNLSQTSVNNYARDMANGRWRLTHQGIAFDKDGGLRDGQHRLAAIVRAGVPIKMLVVKDIDGESFGVMDSGRNRTMADRFQIQGLKDSVQLAAVARRAALWQAGFPWGRKLSPTKEEVAQMVDDNPDLLMAAAFAHSWKARRILPPALAGFVWWIFNRLDEDDAHHFMSRLRDGDGLETKDPIYVLRERLLQRGQGNFSQWMRPELLLALTIMAWNRYRKHETLTKLQLPSTITDESFPRPV
jgi:hypothetical protein